MPAARIKGTLFSCLLSFTAINKPLPALLRHQFQGVEHRSARMNGVNVGGVFAVLSCPCPASTSVFRAYISSCDGPRVRSRDDLERVPNGRTPVASQHIDKWSDNGYAGPELGWHRLHLTRIGPSNLKSVKSTIIPVRQTGARTMRVRGSRRAVP